MPTHKEYTQTQLLHALLRQDFRSFIHKVFNTINPGSEYQHNWHIDLIAEYLEAVKAGNIKRLIINIPPRSLKSICTSVAWPAWVLGHNPDKRILVASYSSTLSVKHSLDCRLILKSSWYRTIFPNTILSNSHNQKTKFLTTHNGFRFATSVGGSTTGEGGEYLIVDDPHNPVHIHSSHMRNKVIEWFEQTFLTRLNNRNTGAIIVVMQRLHEQDLSGYLISMDNSWELLKLPIQALYTMNFSINNSTYLYAKGDVLNKERDQEETLHKLQSEIGMSNYAAQYLQTPLTENHCLLNLKDISFYEIVPETFDYIVQSWDTAIKVSEHSDYSVCTNFGIKNKHYYLTYMLRSKLTYPNLKNEAMRLAQKYSPSFILIEDKASGQQLIQDLKIENFHNIMAIKPRLDKITRFASCVATFQNGQLLLPQKSSFTHTVIAELTSFPNSTNDDIADSISQFINFIKPRSASMLARMRPL